MNFHDLPDERRMALRDIAENAGADTAGYINGGLCLAIKRGAFSAVCAALAEHGMELDNGSLHHFPLGSDNPPEEYRHDGRYPGSRGFWLFGTFQLAEHAAV